MQKKVLVYSGLAVGGAVVAYMVYKKFFKPTDQTMLSQYSLSNGQYKIASAGGQPAMQYPFRAIEPPRVDNSNQPWYGGSRLLATASSAMLPGGGSDIQKAASDLASASSIADSVSSIWDQLNVGSLFDSKPATDSVASGAGDFDWQSLGWV